MLTIRIVFSNGDELEYQVSADSPIGTYLTWPVKAVEIIGYTPT